MATIRFTYDDQPNGCWLWVGTVNSQKPGRDYGRKTVNGKRWLAHNLVYTLLVGPIPDGTELDHLCRTPRCVRPEHLDPVPHRTNVLRGESPAAAHARKGQCPAGHPYDIADAAGRRGCSKCRRDIARAWYAANRGTGTGTGGHQRAKTHCPNGHPYDEENTYRPPKRPTARQCRICTGRKPASASISRRKSHCINGHELAGDNVRMEGERRRCVQCEHDRVKRRRVKRQALAGTPGHVGGAAVNAAKTHCKRGHPLSGENLYVQKSGARVCKECKRMKIREWNQRNIG